MLPDVLVHPIILAPQEAQGRGSQVQSSPEQLSEALSQNRRRAGDVPEG